MCCGDCIDWFVTELRPAPERDLMTHDSCLCSKWLLFATVADKRAMCWCLPAMKWEMLWVCLYGGWFIFFFAPNTTAQHYDPQLTVVHCGYKQSGVSFFCWVICKVVEKENVEDVRHLMEPKPQSNTIHQHMSYKTAADKTILVPTNQQLEFKGL